MSPLVIRLLVLIVIFAAVFLVVEQLISLIRQRQKGANAINKRLQMIEGGTDREIITSRLRKSQKGTFDKVPGFIGRMGRSVERSVIASGVSMPGNQIFIAMAAASAVVSIIVMIGSAVGGYALNFGIIQLSLILGVAVGTGIPLIVLSKMANGRRKKMQEQFPIALDIFVRGLRSGHPISSALELLTREMEDPIGSEFGMVVDEVSYGRDLRDALQTMADRWGIEDIQMFVVSLSVQNETGGNLAEILSNLSSVIRDRASMFMKVRALSSEGRMTALLLTALPVLTFVGLFLVSPTFYLDVSEDPAFLPGVIGLIVLYFMGFFSIRRMVDLKV
jgi:tight adherence protein B